MKQEKNAPGSVGHLPWVILAGFVPKVEPRPKAARSQKPLRGWTLKACSTFGTKPGYVSQRPSRFS
ncbi:hypothetical protein, partial [Brevibacillus borstelensis]|uniref:hypothetical protein n=1 Tax=Brevibacillus borstelensis TaxID=45462 RepID=UPI001FA990F7